MLTPSNPYFGVPPREAEKRLARWLLPHRLRDLQSRLGEDADRYSKLGLSLIIRSLVIDGVNIEALARDRGKIPAPIFSYTPYEVVPVSTPVLGGLHQMDGGSPRLVLAVTGESFAIPTVQGNLAKFLKAPVGQFHDQPVSLQEFVRAFAHILGGVHLGRPKEEHERLLQAAAAQVEPAIELWTSGLQPIGTVVHRALSPIAEAIAADQ